MLHSVVASCRSKSPIPVVPTDEEIAATILAGLKGNHWDFGLYTVPRVIGTFGSGGPGPQG